MADTAFKELYRDEWIQGFERQRTHFRTSVTTDAMTEGKTAYFLVATSNREAVTRGVNGLIPASTSDYTTPSVTLVEEHDKERLTRFKQFTGHADQRAIAQAQSRSVINRAIDDRIITALETGTVSITSGTVMDKGLATNGRVKLGNANVPMDGGIFCAVTPNQWGHLEDDPSFSSADFVEVKPLIAGMPDPQAEAMQMRNWLGINWFVHTGLSGAGTASATCLMYHRSAIGYAYDSGDIDATVGYDDEDDYWYVRHSIFHGSVLLQNTGVVKFTVDDSAYS